MREGFGQEQLEWLVVNNISFYRHILPEPWREELLQAARRNPTMIQKALENSDFFIEVFIEAVAELAPWIPEVLTKERKGYIENEIREAFNDL